MHKVLWNALVDALTIAGAVKSIENTLSVSSTECTCHKTVCYDNTKGLSFTAACMTASWHAAICCFCNA